ncbi:Chorismate mutase AroH [Koleobacter methoxysyntrophicus]|jgi:chorismate mutase|uniref:chorismate mutase n=1 Tax=Koleobacter methoxysyntrophicus TaxID=2751313 RepID=A0A8A0RRE8_9FIRM|nr:chorismate mutase [Koleobacter methoxysyntrophicus]MDI3540853.1 chorismate mutase [Thermosediminibacterales bacterium]MDK2901129.1 chorismate mutase [Thermosediminibacterales bacterium]NPV42386.1 chorismate mutase [Bacillota bacterium]QSQ10120.1 Chorismate mutase AroH [Koleobacter methoxysyntrophicus]
MVIRGVRGAITVKENSSEEIVEKTRILLEKMVQANNIKFHDISAIFFSMTPDLNAAFPAQAARHMGMNLVPLMCFQEIPVPDALSKCIRILLLFNTDKTIEEINHIYLEGAKILRPDLQPR